MLVEPTASALGATLGKMATRCAFPIVHADEMSDELNVWIEWLDRVEMSCWTAASGVLRGLVGGVLLSRRKEERCFLLATLMSMSGGRCCRIGGISGLLSSMKRILMGLTLMGLGSSGFSALTIEVRAGSEVDGAGFKVCADERGVLVVFDGGRGTFDGFDDSAWDVNICEGGGGTGGAGDLVVGRGGRAWEEARDF